MFTIKGKSETAFDCKLNLLISDSSHSPSSSLIHMWFKNLHSASKLDYMVKNSAFQNPGYPHRTHTTPSLLLQAGKRLPTEGTCWNTVLMMCLTHNMSSEHTQDYYRLKYSWKTYNLHSSEIAFSWMVSK